MVEPHITTTLTLSSAVYDSLGEDVQWEIEVADGSYIYPTGRIVTASFNDTGLLPLCIASTVSHEKQHYFARNSDSSSRLMRSNVLAGFRAVRYASTSSSGRRRRRLAPAGEGGDADSNVWACLPKMLARLIARSSERSVGGDAGRKQLEPQLRQQQLGQRQGRRPSQLVASAARGSNAPLALSSTSYTWTEVYMNCLYVRRELRTLNDDDRNAFFDTAEVLFRTPTSEGQDTYGSKYYGIGTFAMAHNILAGNSDCDHMHDGLGFLTNHGAQTVNVSILSH